MKQFSKKPLKGQFLTALPLLPNGLCALLLCTEKDLTSVLLTLCTQNLLKKILQLFKRPHGGEMVV
jgi:hypothetical protein